jgi:hypothetical protein
MKMIETPQEASVGPPPVTRRQQSSASNNISDKSQRQQQVASVDVEERERRRKILLDILDRHAPPMHCERTASNWTVDEEIRLRLAMRIYRTPNLLGQFPQMMMSRKHSAISQELLPFATNWDTVATMVGSRSVDECKRKWLDVMKTIEKR